MRKKKMKAQLEVARVENARLYHELVKTARKTREVAIELLKSSNAIIRHHNAQQED